MKKLNKVALENAKTLTVPEMIDVTGGVRGPECDSGCGGYCNYGGVRNPCYTDDGGFCNC